MKVTGVVCMLMSVALGNRVRISTARDATVSYNNIQNGDGTYDAYTPKGMDPLLTSIQRQGDFRRILLGFDLPPHIVDVARIRRCRLHIPDPIDRPSLDYMLTAYDASNNWEERTVTAADQVVSTRQVGNIVVRRGHNPDDMDVTQACREAQGGRFSLFLDSNFEQVVFNSRNSAKKDNFHIEVSF
ncbi:hypothetical protein IW147_005647 [Coemansia sp. RSA 720]|nr:hypothetical protein LPJ76_004555 [Coemansia sp. RSA 638]KAJ2119725.1 hypothetical protein IW147_005647 [Coemansia sp. RSA 720]